MALPFLGRRLPRAIPPNLGLGPDADASHALARLRASRVDGPLEAGRPLVRGVWLDADPEARARGTVRAGHAAEGAMLDLGVEIDAPARWLTLHVHFGGVDLGGVELLGIAMRTASDETVTIRPCLRSGLGEAGPAEGFSDAFLPKTVVAAPEPTLHLDALDLTSEGRVPLRAPWRELVLFLDARPQRLRIGDLRVFAI